MTLQSTQLLTEMSTRNLPGGVKGGRRVRLTNTPPAVGRWPRKCGASTACNMDSFTFFSNFLTCFCYLCIYVKNLQKIVLGKIYNRCMAHPASYPMGTMFCFPRAKRAGREAGHSPTSAEFEKMWIYTSTPPYVFMA
jgi:hypothetical protein